MLFCQYKWNGFVVELFYLFQENTSPIAHLFLLFFSFSFFFLTIIVKKSIYVYIYIYTYIHISLGELFFNVQERTLVCFRVAFVLFVFSFLNIPYKINNSIFENIRRILCACVCEKIKRMEQHVKKMLEAMYIHVL